MAAGNGSTIGPERGVLKDDNQPSERKQDHAKQSAANKNALRDPIFWLFFVPLVAVGVAAFFTYKQWLTAEDQERHSLRAYVSVQKVAVSGLPAGNNETVWYIGPVWENTGNSTARRLKASSDCKSGVPEDNATLDYAQTSKRPHFFSRILAPHQPTVGRACQKTADELADIQKGNKQIIVWGSAEYRDIFDARHKTRFCSRVQILGDARIPSDNPAHVVKDCEYGNCDDEDCDRMDRERAAKK